MAENLDREWLGGLEHSCRNDLASRIVPAPAIPGFDRIEASFRGSFFEPHRHDTYAIGVTLWGVQSFSYRGQVHHSQPGQIIVLHPDELHDGAAGTEDGLRYRMLYLEPALIRQALNSRDAPLPFVPEPVIEDAGLLNTLLAATRLLDPGLEAIQVNGFVEDIASALQRHGNEPRSKRPVSASGKIWELRDFMADHCLDNISLSQLEAVCGLDRFSLSRQFRSVFGTSPHRFLIMRRLEHARRLMSQGVSLGETAAATGFADQSHMTRHFTRAYGVTPGRWVSAVRAGQEPGEAGSG